MKLYSGVKARTVYVQDEIEIRETKRLEKIEMERRKEHFSKSQQIVTEIIKVHKEIEDGLKQIEKCKFTCK